MDGSAVIVKFGHWPPSRPARDLLKSAKSPNYHTKIMEIPQKIKEYIDSNRLPLPPIKDEDEPLQIDSLAIVRLVAFLETDCGIRIEDEELIAENFANLRKLRELIASKSEAVEAPAQATAHPAFPSATSARTDTSPKKD
jgi:acyl carrier protein